MIAYVPIVIKANKHILKMEVYLMIRNLLKSVGLFLIYLSEFGKEVEIPPTTDSIEVPDDVPPQPETPSNVTETDDVGEYNPLCSEIKGLYVVGDVISCVFEDVEEDIHGVVQSVGRYIPVWGQEYSVEITKSDNQKLQIGKIVNIAEMFIAGKVG
jgi:hypothetical protein